MADSSTTATKPSGVTPTTAVPEGPSRTESSSSPKPNLPASNPNPLPESPEYTASDSIYPPPAEPASRPAAPTSTINNLTELPPSVAATDTLESLDDGTTPTATTTTTVNLTDAPAPQPGAVPTPISTTTTQSPQSPANPQPGGIPRFPIQTPPAYPTATPESGTSFDMPPTAPPVQTTYGPPEVTMRGQPIPSYTATATSTSYSGYSSAIRRSSEIAPMPGGYQQRLNTDHYVPPSQEPPREEGILGKVSKAVDKFNEWMVGEGK
ncbi:hypothetical protein TWF106_008823 [Orbilia oligospora]|uniref:Uncharacterized protein n=1 Tax=Orbilia oligospora TaxID=2813651 RepID=A0A6G1LTS2_ORBOL|nr:hypothetical protein TWF679_003789 [Orbilia oligospora]KAF3214974.1 hypothetical protein TWF106_008823 [Orbilia oligospora]KAF3234258.1 hypothetical protein TWF192_001595 [Orbilia oligospora]